MTSGSRSFSWLEQAWAKPRDPFLAPPVAPLSYVTPAHEVGNMPECKRTEDGGEGGCHTETGRCAWAARCWEDAVERGAVERGAGRTWGVQAPLITAKQNSALLCICFATLANSPSESQF